MIIVVVRIIIKGGFIIVVIIFYDNEKDLVHAMKIINQSLFVDIKRN